MDLVGRGYDSDEKVEFCIKIEARGAAIEPAFTPGRPSSSPAGATTTVGGFVLEFPFLWPPRSSSRPGPLGRRANAQAKGRGVAIKHES